MHSSICVVIGIFFYCVIANANRITHDLGEIPEPIYEPKVTPWAKKTYPLFDTFDVLPPKYEVAFSGQKYAKKIKHTHKYLLIQKNRYRIIEMFKHSFSSYKKYALYADELVNFIILNNLNITYLIFRKVDLVNLQMILEDFQFH